MWSIQIGPWDLALLLAVSMHGTCMAYVRSPQLKAAIYALPIPCTLATLALGQPIGVNHALGLPLVLLYVHGVHWLHLKARWPIVPAIVASALGFCVTAAVLARTVPATPGTFWAGLAFALGLAAWLHLALPHRRERAHGSPLPVAVKFVLVLLVIAFVIAIKSILQGFMAFFPMVGVVGAYEARYSLWTLTRQVPVLILAMVPMLTVCRLAQDALGLGPALGLGWVAFLAVALTLNRGLWRRRDA